MAKKIKFALEMKDGVKVRGIEELRANFDITKAEEHYASGKLVEWLEDRYFDDEVAKISAIDLESPRNVIQRQLCEALGVDVQETDVGEDIGMAIIQRNNEKKEILRQKTSDQNIIAHAAQTAFNRDDLSELWDAEDSTIYLCGDSFKILSRITDRTYIGVLGTPKIEIDANSREELAEKGIKFENVELPEHLRETPARICQKCGEKVRDKAKFCDNCGASMDETEKIDVSSPIAEASEGKVCPMCGQKAQENDGVFCTKCGVKFIEAAEYAKIRICPNCGEKMRGNGKFCTTCGASLDGAREIKEDDLKKNASDKEKNPLPATKKEWKIPKQQLKTMFIATFKKDFDYFRGYERFNPNGIDENATFFMVGPNSNVTHDLTNDQKNMALALICGGQYTEDDLIHLRIPEDMTRGWAFTLDSFCVVAGRFSEIIPYGELNFGSRRETLIVGGHEIGCSMAGWGVDDIYIDLYTAEPLFKFLVNMKNIFRNR